MSSTTLDLNGALKGFFQDREWPFKIMLGGFINCASFGLLRVNPAFLPVSFAMWGLSCGYMLRVMRLAIKGDLEKLPDWSDAIDLLVSGLSWLSISLGFGFFILSILAISLLIAAGTSIISMSNPSFLMWALGTFALIYALVVFFKFFLAVLMANFAEDERMLAGFAWRKVFLRIVKQPLPLLIAWLAGLTLTCAAVVLPSISIVGAVLVPFLSFLAEVIAVRMIGQAWPENK
jgi:ABC-type antimicrobial peptide transport system permease subunit